MLSMVSKTMDRLERSVDGIRDGIAELGERMARVEQAQLAQIDLATKAELQGVKEACARHQDGFTKFVEDEFKPIKARVEGTVHWKTISAVGGVIGGAVGIIGAIVSLYLQIHPLHH